MLNLNSRFEAIYKALPSGARDWAASAYAWWSARKKYGGVFDRWCQFLQESQWWSQDRLEEYQVEQLEELLLFVYRESPFYREVMARTGVKPGTTAPLAMLRRLPVTNRATVKAHHDGIKTRLVTDPKLTLSTSGTTGASLHVPQTAEALQREYAFRWQFYSMGGARRGDRFALFQGQMVVPLSQQCPPFHIRNHAENTIMFSLYHMDDTSMHAYARALNEFSPDHLYGYPSGLFVLAAFLKARSIPTVRPKSIFTASEMLHGFQKQTIETTFHAPTFQWYGQVETTANLHECDHHRLHVKEEYGLLELMADDGTAARPGQVARAVATGWGNQAFPLLRYDTGDLMVLAEDQRCACGRGGRIIERIVGRDDDFILTPEGRYIGRLDFVFKPVDTVRESQIVQEDATNLVVRVVPAEGYSGSDERLIIEKLKERVGDSMRIRVETTHRIPRGAGGKFRYVVSHVKPVYWAAGSTEARVDAATAARKPETGAS